MNNLTIKIKVKVLLIWVLKLCYGFLKLSGHSKEPELEFDKPLKRIALPRRHEFCMLIYPQRRVDGSLLALHLPYVSGFCSYFWRARTIYSPFNLFVFWQACGVCLGLVLTFLWSIADRPSSGTRWRKLQRHTYRSRHPQLSWRLELMDKLRGGE